ncbi:MAG: OmpH family outer membrane protein [Candidatus Thiodiazotropha sp. (ex Lucinoma aequizonata)]|nr:OmpH family outer membrane protein [Candidatus Thiodiazotropha sp. (ex Lucinoma aequizonata)]MCU7887923.1 OmpH family outer membrane protein [Candidatus Thiodiazotropha sp. (ex Lucinoma aequizonata)]MCU7897110.1 OmpH family outer membrane protein [Candidatus Thiodiazotropha sp. (ex Lucinoma aequizonata)]MCU7899736.1 OmpH family outer membrane protein [Candidatus Thiodiazotropha sp. (ex Lucinoma aequizonata)]MCU7901103.1 OmpH family outer membrane protein [Candidatus Thiodiazotropha sp. (ex L
MNLLRYILLALTLVFCVTGSVLAEEYRIVFVNATKVFEESPQYKKARERLQTEFSRREKDLLVSRKQLKQVEEKLVRDGSVMSESEVTSLERDILNRTRKLKNAQTEFREDLNLRQNEEFKKLRQQVREVIQEVGKKEKIDLILSDGVVYFSKNIDISELVLEKLRQLKAE